jgi:hypothetical protein
LRIYHNYAKDRQQRNPEIGDGHSRHVAAVNVGTVPEAAQAALSPGCDGLQIASNGLR